MKQPVSISVLVATRNRANDLVACLTAILRGTYDRYEVLIADQSTTTATQKIIKQFNDRRIKYYRLSTTGKSRALNYLWRKAKGDIVAFTDDDCIAHSQWLARMAAAYDANPTVGGVLGSVHPYRPNLHHHQVCPSLFVRNVPSIIHDRHVIAYKAIGMGNNMSFRKQVVMEAGDFFSWLGPGAPFGFAGGDESEYLYRVLSLHHALFYDPTVVVYHNRWIRSDDDERLQAKYSLGLYAFWYYYLFTQADFPLLYAVAVRVRERIGSRLLTILRHCYHLRFGKAVHNASFLADDISAYMAGLGHGFFRAAQRTVTTPKYE
jgi:glycosyltransferase involved in cell wall biosynthesis